MADDFPTCQSLKFRLPNESCDIFFITKMKEKKSCFVKYAGDVKKKVEMQLAPGEHKLELVMHDEMTTKANNVMGVAGRTAIEKKGC